MNAEYLKVKLSTTNKFDSQLFGKSNRNQGLDMDMDMDMDMDTNLNLKTLRGKKRIVAICGPTNQLKDALLSFRIFRRRLQQSNSIVIAVPTDLGDASVKSNFDWESLGVTEGEIRSSQWFALPQDINSWKTYFQDLVNNDNKNNKNDDQKLTWFGLNYNGRSFASGSGEAPVLLQILGQNLRPIEILDEDDEPESMSNYIKDDKAVEEVKSCQLQFYKALTEGNLEGMNMICAKSQADEVTQVLNAGGRIDEWKSCLADDAKPANMKISGSDFLIVSRTLAYSTCIEFPANTGGYNDPFGATLLAIQRWSKLDEVVDESSSSTGTWKLEYHSTIPWSSDSRAGGTLRCDGRGCVALTRGTEKRTFGGLIG